MSDIKTGILLRRNNKDYFLKNPPISGEIVHAIDTDEIGMLVKNKIVWTPIQGVVNTVAGKQGDVVLNKEDVGLENIDNTSDLDKPISNLTRLEFEKHYNANNPHNITKKTLNLENVDNTSDIDKPVSNLTLIELNKKISWDDARAQAGGKDPVFTDTTYEVKDGELSEYNFNEFYKNFIDTFNQNARVLPDGHALSINGNNLTLFRADGSSQTVQTQDTIYDDTEIKGLISNVENKIIITDNLTTASADQMLSANQGVILKGMIDEILRVIEITDEDFQTLQDIIVYIEENRDKFDDLTITNIRGLQDALDNKVSQGSGPNIAPNSDLLQGKQASDFVDLTTYTNAIEGILSNINSLNEQVLLFETKSGVNQKISQAIADLNLEATFSTIEESINNIIERLNQINVDEILNSFQDLSNEINNKVTQLTNLVNEKLGEFQLVIDQFDPDLITAQIREVRDYVSEEIVKIQGQVDLALETIETSINDINNLVANKADIEYVNTTKQELLDALQAISESTNIAKPQNNILDKTNSPSDIQSDDIDIKISELTGDNLTEFTMNYYKEVAKACKQNLEDSRLWRQINVTPDSPNPLGDIDFSQPLTTEINITFSNEVDFRFNIQHLKFDSSTMRLDAVNLVTKKLLFTQDYTKTLYNNIEDVKLKISNDSTFGKFIERANLTSPNTFQKIMVDQPFETLEPSENRMYYEASYEIMANSIKLIFNNYVNVVSLNVEGTVDIFFKQGDKIVKILFNEWVNDVPNTGGLKTADFGQFLNENDKQDAINYYNEQFYINNNKILGISKSIDILEEAKSKFGL